MGHPLCLGAIWRYLRHDELAVLLKSVSRLGNSEQQGRLFGFFETGRGIVDTVVAFSALAVFTWFGSGLLGFKAGIWFYSLIVIAVGIIIFFVLNDKEEAPSVEVKKKTEHRKTPV